MKRFESFLARLAQFQYERAGLVLLIAVAISAGSLVLVRKLTLDTSFVALLPQNKPSVRDLETLGDRVGGLRTLTVAVQSPSGDLEGMQRFIRAAAPRMAALDASSHDLDFGVATRTLGSRFKLTGINVSIRIETIRYDNTRSETKNGARYCFLIQHPCDHLHSKY